MTIYVFSLLVGYQLSGVDYAIVNRENYLKRTKYDRKYIFSQIPEEAYIERYENIGIDIKQMMSVHLFLAGHYSMAGNYKVKDKLSELSEVYGELSIVEDDRYLNVYANGNRVANIYLKDNKKFFSRISYYQSERLIAVEHYSDKLLFRDYYVTANENNYVYAKKARTAFINEKGENVYECIYGNSNEEDIYTFNNGAIYNTSELMELFVYQLKLTEKDIVIIDRPGSMKYVQALFKVDHKAKIMPFLHTNHYFEKNEDDAGLYLNYEYYYWFKYSDRIDAFLVSTEEQKDELEQRLKIMECHVPEIQVLFIGGLKELRKSEMLPKRHSLITVSRINARKKIDWIIMSVIKAYKMNSEISLDIYGEGAKEYTEYINKMIYENNAQDYIQLKGYCDVTEVYKGYEVYISASLWETLGLSVMEAVGSGNAIIGLDVHYGNRLFVKSDENGYLIDFDIKDPSFVEREDEITTKMANKIVEIFSDDERLQRFRCNSYNIARQYLNENVEKKWIEFFDN